MRIGLVSMDQQLEKLSENRVIVENYFRLIDGLNLVIFPEMTLTGYTMRSEEFSEEFEDSETIEFFRGLSVKYRVDTVFGVNIRESGEVFNSLIYMSSSGEVIGNYRKMHPFSFAGEDRKYSSGEEPSTAGDFGLSICYDLRFPELYSHYSKTKKAVINIANWPKKRVGHWRTLLKARAIENQMVVIAVNRSGTDSNGFQYEESSGIYLPSGDEVAPESVNGTLKIYDIDLSIVESYRKSFNTVADKRFELYRELM
jgi:predicted amidohydrolase